MTKITVTHDDIVTGLKKLPIRKDPVLFVHSSLKSFGYVEGGADTVIDALIDFCGPRGTLLIPTLSFSSIDEKKPVFDVSKTPSDTGLITEIFRKREGVLRSLHITSSAAAYGKYAEELTNAHHTTPCGTNSPYRKCIELDGDVLFLGAKFQSNTLFHCAEEAVGPPYMRYKTIEKAHVTDANGKVSVADYTRYDCYQTGVVRKLDRMEAVFRVHQAITDQIIGKSHVMHIDAKTNFSLCCETLKKNVYYLWDEK